MQGRTRSLLQFPRSTVHGMPRRGLQSSPSHCAAAWLRWADLQFKHAELSADIQRVAARGQRDHQHRRVRELFPGITTFGEPIDRAARRSGRRVLTNYVKSAVRGIAVE